MKKFRILVDMDDVLVDTVGTWVNWLNAVYACHVNYDDLKVWEMQVAYPSLTVKQIRAPLMKDHFWRLVRPLPGAVEYLKKLIDDGHEVFICSASHPFTITPKIKECLLKHFDYLDTTKIIFTYRKQMIDADFLIDDGIHNLIDGPYQGIIMSTPYNEAIKETEYEKDLVRVTSFKEAYEYITEKANEQC